MQRYFTTTYLDNHCDSAGYRFNPGPYIDINADVVKYNFLFVFLPKAERPCLCPSTLSTSGGVLKREIAASRSSFKELRGIVCQEGDCGQEHAEAGLCAHLNAQRRQVSARDYRR